MLNQQQMQQQELRFSTRDLAIALGIAAVSLAVFLPFAPLDPDPHHDGIHYAVALAISEGWRVHADVFSGYGPTTALLQGLLLELFPPNLLTLRIFNALLLAGISASAYGISRLIRIRRLPSILLSLTWVLLCPAWGVYSEALPLWPWPSVLFTFVAQLSILLSLVALRGPRAGALLLLASAFAVLTVTIRANQGIPFLLGLLLAFLVTPQGRQLIRAHKWELTVGAVVPPLILTSYLAAIGAVRPAVHDSLIGPISAFLLDDLDPTSRVAAPIDLRARIVEGYVFPSLPLFIIIGLVLLALHRRSWGTRGLMVLAATATVITITIASLGYYGWPRYLFQSLFGDLLPLTVLNEFGIAPLYAACLGAVIAFLYWSVTALNGRQWPLQLSETMLLFASLSFMTQLVPRWDVYHLWWAGPLIMMTCFYFITRKLCGNQQVAIACIIAVPYGTLAAYSWYNKVQVERVSISEGPLQGMQVLPDRVVIVDALSESMAVIPQASAYFLCDDGLISAMNGLYLSDRPNFVQGGWSNQPEPSEYPPFIVTCVDSEEDVKATESRIPTDFELVRGPVRMDLSPWSQTELRIYRDTSPQ